MSAENPPLTQEPSVPAPPVEEAAAPSVEEPAGPAGTAVVTEPDPVAAAAIDLAREAAVDVAEPGTVGDHLGVTVDDLGLTMHSFVCRAKGYRGWRWAVTLAHVPGADRATVCDVVLLPGADSILPPVWVPWSDRLAPGDLGAGDELPYRPDDPLLVPGYTVTDEDDADQQLFWELGLGRERVVGREGLDAAADRWAAGSHGPTSEIARQASARCLTCGYFVSVAGRLRQNFGVCTNEWSPVDGTVVTIDFGCGAHSETDLELPSPEPLPPHILDETMIERFVLEELRQEVEAAESGSTPATALVPAAGVESGNTETRPTGTRPTETGLTETGLTETGLTETGLTETGLTETGLTGSDAAAPSSVPPADLALVGSGTGWPSAPSGPDDGAAGEAGSSPTGMPAGEGFSTEASTAGE